MVIRKEIEVKRKGLPVVIDVTYGTDLIQMEFKVTDCIIPAESSAVAYSQGRTAEVHKQICTIDENVISFTPEKGFFEEGRNELQLRVVHNNRSLFTFKCRVECQGSFADSDAEEVKRNSSLVEQLMTEQAVTKARLEEVLKLPDDGTEVEKAVNDIKVGADGKVYSSPGEAVRQQIGQVSKQIDTLAEFENYTNLLEFSPKTLHFDSSNLSLKIAEDLVDIEANTTYFGYVGFNISNLSNYEYGNLYLQFWNSLDMLCEDKSAGANDQIIKNGYIELYGFVTSDNDGNIQTYITSHNTSKQYSFDLSIDKLYLIKTNDLNVIGSVKNNEYSSELKYVNFLGKVKTENIVEDSVTYEKLSADLKKLFPSVSTIVDCWGDSLTKGSGGINYSYPKKLQELLGNSFVVNNYGQGSETAEVIAWRQGGMLAIAKPFECVNYANNPIEIESVNGASLETANFSGLYNGNGIVYINGDKYQFQRTENGFVVHPQDGSYVGKTYRSSLVVSEGKGINHIMLICIGQNGWVDDNTEHLADIIQNMINHNNYDKYIVIGRPTGNKAEREQEEKILATRFGSHFVNAREYISLYGLSDNNLTPTQADNEAILNGSIPPQIKSDDVHLNDYGYIAKAICVYQRGKDLGYWS